MMIDLLLLVLNCQEWMEETLGVLRLALLEVNQSTDAGSSTGLGRCPWDARGCFFLDLDQIEIT